MPGVLHRVLVEEDRDLYLEITPMLDEHWTGISMVAAGLAEVFLRLVPDNVQFFVRHEVVAKDAVRDAIARASGLYLHRDFQHGEACAGPLKPGARRTMGLFSTVKTVRNVFDCECSIIHDLSTLITPQFHTLGNIAFHMGTIIDDLRSNARTVCVSEATASDLVTYLGVDPGSVVTALNGVNWPAAQLSAARNRIGAGPVEPYLLVLGTREPRKNIALVLDLVEQFPEVLDSFRLVFTGKIGWLEEEQKVTPAIRSHIDAGRIRFTGFLSDTEKCSLLMGAEATIYPSFFEGFGLPILESLSLGTPCLASISSSMPEIGGDLCRYFDPFSVSDLYGAVTYIAQTRPKHFPAFHRRCVDHAAAFTWHRMAEQIVAACEQPLRDPGRGDVVGTPAPAPALEAPVRSDG